MQVLTRKVNGEIVIADDIVVTVRKISPTRVELAIDAPASYSISRSVATSPSTVGDSNGLGLTGGNSR